MVFIILYRVGILLTILHGHIIDMNDDSNKCIYIYGNSASTQLLTSGMIRAFDTIIVYEARI